MEDPRLGIPLGSVRSYVPLAACRTQKLMLPSSMDKNPMYSGTINDKLNSKFTLFNSVIRNTRDKRIIDSPVAIRMARPRRPMLHLPGT